MSIFEPLSKWRTASIRWGSALLRPPSMQVAALCYRKTKDGHDILLVQSRGRKQWILPKGWPKEHLTSAQAAAEEAYEEAGARGAVSETAIGTYRYTKSLSPGVEIPCLAYAYPVEVSERATHFPEAEIRNVKWFSAETAAEMVSAPELRSLLQAFRPS